MTIEFDLADLHASRYCMPAEIKEAITGAIVDRLDHWKCFIRNSRNGLIIYLTEEDSETNIVRFRWKRVFEYEEVRPSFIREIISAAIKDT